MRGAETTRLAIVDPTALSEATIGQRDQDPKGSGTACVVIGAVDRIDDPGWAGQQIEDGGIRMRVLFADDADPRIELAQPGSEQFFRLAIGHGDDIVRRLVLEMRQDRRFGDVAHQREDLTVQHAHDL